MHRCENENCVTPATSIDGKKTFTLQFKQLFQQLKQPVVDNGAGGIFMTRYLLSKPVEKKGFYTVGIFRASRRYASFFERLALLFTRKSGNDQPPEKVLTGLIKFITFR
jgi:hypothetical protein